MNNFKIFEYNIIYAKYERNSNRERKSEREN
jgi:hypothetical protein